MVPGKCCGAIFSIVRCLVRSLRRPYGSDHRKTGEQFNNFGPSYIGLEERQSFAGPSVSGCPPGFTEHNGSSCYYVKTNETYKTPYDRWNTSHEYCNSQVHRNSSWPQPRTEADLEFLRGLLLKYGFIGAALGIERYVNHTDNQSWRYTGSWGKLARGHSMWESDATSSGFHPCPDSHIQTESASCVCTGIIRRSFLYKWKSHTSVSGADGFTFSKMVTPDVKQFFEAKACKTNQNRNFFTQYGGVLCEYRTDDCRNNASYCSSKPNSICDPLDGYCHCITENYWFSTTKEKQLNSQCVRPLDVPCSTSKDCPEVKGVRFKCDARAGKCACAPYTADHCPDSAVPETVVPRMCHCRRIVSANASKPDNVSTAIAKRETVAGKARSCNNTMDNLYNRETDDCTDVAHLSCPDYQSCPEIDGVQMHCDHRNGKCRCPTGTQRHNSQCVGASLRSHEGDKFLKNLEKSVRLVQNGFRIPTVTAICYDQPSVERCYCGEREDYPGAPVCDCGSMTPRSVVCLSRLTNMEIFGECLGGYICSLESNVYEDIDECSRPELNDCDLIRGTCHNTPGSYECICVDGREFVFDPKGKSRGICMLHECAVNECNETISDCVALNQGYMCKCRVDRNGSSNVTEFRVANDLTNGPKNETCMDQYFLNYRYPAQQLCENKRSSGIHYSNPVSVIYEAGLKKSACICPKRTSYMNRNGYCEQGSHLFEMILFSENYWTGDYADHFSLRYIQLVAVAEQWTLLVLRNYSTGSYNAVKRVTTHLRRENESKTVVIHVGVLFNVRSGNQSFIPVESRLRQAAKTALVNACGEGTNSGSPCTLHTHANGVNLRIATNSISRCNFSLTDPCLTPEDNDCDLNSTVCVYQATEAGESTNYAYECRCKKEFKVLSRDEHREKCRDVDECESFGPTCEPKEVGKCSNFNGGHTCSCPLSYAPDAGGHICVARNLCATRNCGPHGFCKTTNGMDAHCICNPGFMNEDDKVHGECVDENECERHGYCSGGNSRCVDTEGSVQSCRCRRGFHTNEEGICAISDYSFDLLLPLVLNFHLDLINHKSQHFISLWKEVEKLLTKELFSKECTNVICNHFAEGELQEVKGFTNDYVILNISLRFEHGNFSSALPTDTLSTTIAHQNQTSYVSSIVPTLDRTTSTKRYFRTLTGSPVISTRPAIAEELNQTWSSIKVKNDSRPVETSPQSWNVTHSWHNNSTTSIPFSAEVSKSISVQLASRKRSVRKATSVTVAPQIRSIRLREDVLETFLRDAIPSLCNEGDKPGTCRIKGTALHIPITTTRPADKLPVRMLPVKYPLKVLRLRKGCGAINDCDPEIGHECKPKIWSYEYPYTYKCECRDGIKRDSGSLLEQHRESCWTPCTPNPCLNGGICVPRADQTGRDFECRCVPPHTGTVCNNPRCDDIHCSLHGICSLVDGVINCDCYKFYSGSNCSVNATASITAAVAVTFSLTVFFLVLSWVWKRLTTRKRRDWWEHLNPNRKRKQM